MDKTMKKIDNSEIQPLLLKMLHAFHDFCVRHEIQYYAAGGTLLGAVRHKGFIPWDDDIDLYVKEADANKIFSVIARNPFIDEEKRYQILAPAKAPNVYPTIKVIDTHTVLYERNIAAKYACGLWIDVFKITYWPNDENEAKAIYAEQTRLKKWLQMSIFGNLKDRKYKLIYPIALPVKAIMLACGKNSDYWSRRLYNLGSKERTDYIGNLSWSSSVKDRNRTEWYEDSVLLPFEDMMIPAPIGYEKVLKQFYNDYMQLPPPEKRVRHDFDAYYINAT